MTPPEELSAPRAFVQWARVTFKNGHRMRIEMLTPCLPFSHSDNYISVEMLGEPEPLYTRAPSIGDADKPTDAGPWCQPMEKGKHTRRQFLVRFDDTERGDAVFDDEGEAREYWEKADTHWNCYLFGALPLYTHPSQLSPADKQADGLVATMQDAAQEAYLMGEIAARDAEIARLAAVERERDEALEKLADAAGWRERVADDYGKALDALAAAEAKVLALTTALEPFAKLDMPAADKWTCGTFLVEHADIRRARAALEQAKP